ncbi:MAG TPA: hypothetical protein PK728_00880 [Bacillota bacterium]|nr:hypothetical protein [Bacillota bacterium]
MPKSHGENSLGDRDGILAKVRLDFRGTGKPGRFLFRGKPTDKAAEEAREQQVAVLRNVPLQGVQIVDIDISNEVYTVYDDLANSETAFAPLMLTVKADGLEGLVRFIAREEFRKIEILDPAFVTLSHSDVERVLFKVYEEMKEYRSRLDRKYNLK